MATPFHVKVMTPDRTFFDSETEQIIIRTTEGDVGILAKHINYVASLPSGALKIKMSDGQFKVAAVSSGMVNVTREETVIIASAVEWADEIDIAWAKRSEDDARNRLKEHDSGLEFERASMKLKRALNRISISEKNY